MFKIWFRLLLFFSAIFFNNSLIANASEFDKSMKTIESRILEGRYYKVLNLCDVQLKKFSLSSDQRYELLIIKSKVYFWQEEMERFLDHAKKAYELKRKKSPIYKAYFLAQKAAYYHYDIIGDSAVLFSNQSMTLLHKYWRERNKIHFPFIYQSYASSLLYHTYQQKSDNPILNKYLYGKPILTYLDSALFYYSQNNYFPQDQAIVYRTIGNRIMDAVGYNLTDSISELPHPSIQLTLANEAILFYDKALESLPYLENYLRVHILSLKALAYYCTGRLAKGDSVIRPLIRTISKDPVNEIGYHLLPSLYALQYYTQSLLNKKSIDKRIYGVISIYKAIMPLYELYIEHNPKKDTYGSSPKMILSFIYMKLLEKKRINSKLKHESARLAICDYEFYSKYVSKRRINRSRKYSDQVAEIFEDKAFKGVNKKLHLTLKSKNNDYLEEIQNKLKKNEALIIANQGVMNFQSSYLISKSNIYFDIGKLNESNDVIISPNVELNKIKNKGFELWKKFHFSKIIKNLSINKLYVAINLDYPFNQFLTDTLGNSLSSLSYFKKKVNVVKVYNPIDFFCSNESNMISSEERTGVISNKSDSIRLPFTMNFLKKWSKSSQLKQYDVNLLYEEGIIHYLDHGIIYKDFLMGWQNVKSQSNLFKKRPNDKIKRDLITLNFCFSGFKRPTFLPDRDLQHFLISRGAKGVIASPYETVDQSSAFIFKKFYDYLFKGKTVEDALQLSKLDYLKTHKGSLAHPLYWSTYELTSNVKDLRMKLEVKEHGNNQYLVLLLFASIFLITIIFFRLLIEKFI